MDGGAFPIGAVASVLGTAIGFTQKVFEVYAVDEQAKSLLKTVDQISCELQDARLLRRQKSSLFTNVEKRMIDDTFRRTDDAIGLVASLAEPSRADLQVCGGKVRISTRVLFVLRDSPRIQVCLTQLGIASQSLNRDIQTLCSRTSRLGSSALTDSDAATLKPPPPSYDEVMFMHEGRRRNVLRRNGARSADGEARKLRASPALTSVSSLTAGMAELEAEPVTRTDNIPILPQIIAQHTGNEEELDLPNSLRIAVPSVEIQRARSGRARSLRWLEMNSG